MTYGLSKSKITAFEQCPKKLWLSVHRPELAEQDAGAEQRFAAGHEVGAVACALHPGGVMVDADPDLRAALKQTAELLGAGWNGPIFEATFAHDGVLVRADLMLPADEGGWHVAEVKSSTGLKPYHVPDIATQIWVMRECGVEVASASIRHLDSAFRLTETGNYEGLFSDERVELAIEPIIEGRPAVIAEARLVLAGDEPPKELGDHCRSPFECEFQAYCGQHLPPPPEWPSSLLPDGSGKKIARSWAEKGIDDLTLIPASEMSSPKLLRVHEATISGEVYWDRDGIVTETACWTWPRHFLDFETIAFAVPRWVGTGPWRQVPFQFSCHTRHEDGRLEHREFLSLDGADPRRACAEALIEILSGSAGEGAIVAYNAGFERRCLSELADALPDLRAELEAIRSRVVDLLPVTRAHYYHRDQRGSWSIKAVIPTVCPELDYGGLGEVKAGDDAQAAYLEAISEDISDERGAEIRSALLAYCERDTLAMVEMLTRLTSREMR
ncbi:DUF2779 domain-containing protein [Sphingosinicella humi]|uniref:DUF2779 domain-containing protein n=1 Tax=Allosphingosinicella humi TaxID=2068657 RepID=A0A2U2J5B6_9SPHN|nr:DUF2779 domain-containing protein [Sphingosinicella humi]PWG03533.1 DUF2779 domain-containing protein [Sphingosinicella humi]